MDGKEKIWDSVESFRKEHVKSPHLPVDVFEIVDLELGLNVIPFADLSLKYNVDAAITQDLTGIYVDHEQYMYWEKGPVWKQHRTRFSVAHELGHYVLHKSIASTHHFKSFSEFKSWTKTNNGQKYSLEQAANEFAGRLLVPLDRLKAAFESLSKGVSKTLPNWNRSAAIRNMFAGQISPNFGVNDQVIEVRLEREGLWLLDDCTEP